MKNHNVSHIGGVISLSCTLRGFNVDLLYRRPKLCLTGLGPHNDSLICKLIQVCNWPSIETTGALNSKTSFFLWLLYSWMSCMPQRLVCCVGQSWGGGDSSREKRKKVRRGKEMSTWTPLEITSGAINSGSSGSHSHVRMHTESSSLWFFRSEVRHKITQWCYSVVHLILNLLSSLSTLFGLWRLLQPAKWKATVGDRFSVCLLNQGEWKILCCVKDSLV